MRYVLLILLASCASGSSEFHRGTMVAPPPAPARPGVGAPIRGQPGEPHAYPRSPYIRTLPQTPETMRQPGIWASDAPSEGRPVVLPQVYGVDMPMPDGAKEVRDIAHLKMCANMLPPTMKRSGVGDPRWLTAGEARCVVAGYLWQCMEFMKDTYLREWMRQADRNALEGEIQAAREFFKRSCAGDGDTERARGLYLMRPKWDVREANP